MYIQTSGRGRGKERAHGQTTHFACSIFELCSVYEMLTTADELRRLKRNLVYVACTLYEVNQLHAVFLIIDNLKRGLDLDPIYESVSYFLIVKSLKKTFLSHIECLLINILRVSRYSR